MAHVDRKCGYGDGTQCGKTFLECAFKRIATYQASNGGSSELNNIASPAGPYWSEAGWEEAVKNWSHMAVAYRCLFIGHLKRFLPKLTQKKKDSEELY